MGVTYEISEAGDEHVTITKASIAPGTKYTWLKLEEVVKIVYKPRSKEREVLGVARIIRKETKDLNKQFHYYVGGYSTPNTPDTITPDEAEDDGFTGMHGGGDTEKMRKFFIDTYGYSRCKEPINKLTLYWIKNE